MDARQDGVPPRTPLSLVSSWVEGSGVVRLMVRVQRWSAWWVAGGRASDVSLVYSFHPAGYDSSEGITVLRIGEVNPPHTSLHTHVPSLLLCPCHPPATPQRDVPGLTRAAVPILVRQGVKALSVGVNAGSAPPGVPKSTPFIWTDPQSGEELVAMWHEGAWVRVYV